MQKRKKYKNTISKYAAKQTQKREYENMLKNVRKTQIRQYIYIYIQKKRNDKNKRKQHAKTQI